MAKIQNDKYYTSPELAKYCVEKTKEIIGENNITEYIEPSAGSGVFLDYLDKPYLAYDIEPEDDRVVKADWLEVNLDYKKGRCVIGNPPFGDRNKDLCKLFYLKSIRIADYIAFILPISQYNNDVNLYEFDLIYSKNLGIKLYTDSNIHCCFNIYRRPINGELNSKPNYKLKDVSIRRHTRNSNEIYQKDWKHDIRICCFGNVGKICEYENQYAKEYCIRINNKKYADEIIKTLKNTDWDNIYPSISTPYLSQWQINKHLKEQIPELE